MSTPRPWSTDIATYFAQLDGSPPPDQFDTATPRLALGPHWGIIEGFNPAAPTGFDLESRTDALLAEAAERGASIARVQVDWSELETAPGVYDQGLLDSLLAELRDYDQAGFVTLSTLDSDALTLPAYLLDSETGLLIEGLSLSSPEVEAAFEVFLDWFVPQLTEAGVWGLALGNEVEIPVEDGSVTSGEAALFFENGLAHVQTLDPDLAATVTFTTGAAMIAPDLVARVVAASDIFTVNFYGDNADDLPTPDDWAAGLAGIKEMAAGKPIFFQELGMPVGYADAGLPGESEVQSSLETQSAFFDFMGQQIANDPQLLGATVFQLYDWSPALIDSFLEGLDTDFFAGFAEALATLGLVSWTDGTTRPAWSSWLEALDIAEAVRIFQGLPQTEGTEGRDIFRLNSCEGDVAFAGAGNDWIRSGAGNDALDLGAGNDRAVTRGGDDVVLGREGADTIRAGAGDDWVEGGAGRDRLIGQAGADHLDGGAENDRLYGGAGDDVLLGGSGDDLLRAGGGDDFLSGGSGNDTLIGGPGADVFVFEPGGGVDEVRCFQWRHDLIYLDADLVGDAQTGADVVEAFGTEDGALVFGDDSLVLTGVKDLALVTESIVLF